MVKARAGSFLIRWIASFTFCLAWLCAATAQAQTPQLIAVPTTELIAVDGVLDEAAWQTAQTIDTLRQREPDEGAPASERTQVRVLYSSTQLYVGITCFSTLR